MAIEPASSVPVVMDDDARGPSLLKLLLGESALLDSLLAAVDAQDQAMLAGRFEDLSAITERQNALVRQLADADAARETALQALGFPATRAGADVVGKASPAIAKAWSGVLERAERARDLTMCVQAKVNTNRGFVADALAFLHARSAPVYGPDGARRQGRGRNSLALG